ncbi:hypothetical protein [Rhodococcoides fascians]|uniref:hypothetical protein n=1 Tax=Rhodococcoides fascians TaxID=1828 RepID=UPI000563FE84|nr:hypothetical protein [Rhodococcus fascians]
MTRRRAEYIERYAELRASGFTHQQIATDYGVQLTSLMQALHRNGLYVPEAHERETYFRRDRLIASGRPFTTYDLPESGDAWVRRGAVDRAVSAGRLRAVGEKKFREGTRHLTRTIYQATQEESQCLRTA